MLDLVRLFVGGIGIAGFFYLARRIPPLLRARTEWANRVGAATRYEAWRGTPGSGPDLADRLDISPSTLSRILNGKMDISYEMAVRLSAVLGRTAESWINLQAAYSLEKAKSKIDTRSLKPLAFA